MEGLRKVGNQVVVASPKNSEDLASNVERSDFSAQDAVKKDRLTPKELEEGRRLILGLLHA